MYKIDKIDIDNYYYLIFYFRVRLGWQDRLVAERCGWDREGPSTARRSHDQWYDKIDRKGGPAGGKGGGQKILL